MAQTANPFVLQKVGLTLTKVGGAGTEQEFRCQLSRAELVPAASSGGGGATLDTFCASYSDSGAGSSTWTLELSGFQAWSDVTDFSVISFNDEGEKYNFSLTPIDFEAGASTTNPAFEGEVTMVATPIGGTAKQYAQFSASLPCTAKPTMVTA